MKASNSVIVSQVPSTPYNTMYPRLTGQTPSSSYTDMASIQSSVSLQELEERIRALELEKKRREPEKDYVYVQEEESDEPTEYSTSSSAISISTTEQWEKELMHDPKVVSH
jgi:hypothetical protein